MFLPLSTDSPLWAFLIIYLSSSLWTIKSKAYKSVNHVVYLLFSFVPFFFCLDLNNLILIHWNRFKTVAWRPQSSYTFCGNWWTRVHPIFYSYLYNNFLHFTIIILYCFLVIKWIKFWSKSTKYLFYNLWKLYIWS